MVLKITVDCDECNDSYTFCTYDYPDDVGDTIPCPKCGKDADVIEKVLVTNWEEMKTNATKKERRNNNITTKRTSRSKKTDA
ncbi:MAG: hypothetical protein WC907_04740 [Acholeplasmataceae bacterium]|jgi:hypothetical protein